MTSRATEAQPRRRESARFGLSAAFVEFYRHGSPWILTLCLAAAVVLRALTPGVAIEEAVLVAAMIAYWPIHEWLIHVLALHFRPRKLGPFTIDLHVAKAHRLHHQDPWNLERTFIPLRTYVLLPLIWALWLVPPLPPGLARTGLVTYFALSLSYEWFHYLMHTRYAPRGALYSRMWRNHRLHHCKNEHYWFGVTMLNGDRLFRTAPEPRAVELSKTCRTLGHVDDLGPVEG